ncbi:MAG: hypothetical protein M3Q46_09445, partial [Verrucomicrobiota bacterium]|nr:hypothetical protein [Verrucomicrobiota bacterium]
PKPTPTPEPSATPTPTPTATPTPTPTPPSQWLPAVASRKQVNVGKSTTVGTFLVDGTVAKSYVLRALGPSLSDIGVKGAISDPILEIYNTAGTLVAQNDNWNGPLANDVVLAGLTPKHAAESLIDVTLAPGRYSVVVRGAPNASGLVAVERYDR